MALTNHVCAEEHTMATPDCSGARGSPIQLRTPSDDRLRPPPKSAPLQLHEEPISYGEHVSRPAGPTAGSPGGTLRQFEVPHN